MSLELKPSQKRGIEKLIVCLINICSFYNLQLPEGLPILKNPYPLPASFQDALCATWHIAHKKFI